MKRKIGNKCMLATGLILSTFIALICYAAYNHNGDTDSINFRTVYPQAIGSKLDSCNLCHKGGTYTPPGGRATTYVTCQYCHAITNYGADTTQYVNTLNPYGLDYLNNGRGAAALAVIENLDSDGDGYSNKVEIAALRYPGDPTDDPTKVPAPSKVFTRQQLEAMPQHTQVLLMNATKSTDTYAQYSGVPLGDLIDPIKLPSAVDVQVMSPDGFSQLHPFQYTQNAGMYNVYGTYAPANFYYNAQADVGQNPSTGWCDYSAPSAQGRNNGDAIVNPNGLKLIVAFMRDGQYLVPGYLDLT